jgi:hypothetical protein
VAQAADIAPPASVPPAPRPREPRGSLWGLRIVAILHAVATIMQPILAGAYLSGSVDSLGIHEMNAHVVTLFAMLLFVAGLIYAIAGRGRWRIAFAPIGMLLLEFVQEIFGYSQSLAVHIPLGVTVVLINVLFAIWTFTTGARRTRPVKVSS